jgi:hypothetical protein
MQQHSDRPHSKWAASSSAANFACPGRLRMVQDAPADSESEAAAWGTAAHQVSEDCLQTGRDAVEHIGRFVQTKSHRIEVDEEMAETAQVYVDYVKAAAYSEANMRSDGKLLIEQKFSLERLNPPFEAGGTADAVVFHPEDKLLEVIDLKGGRGVVVEAKGNPQLRTYALGALLTFRGYDVQYVKVTIVQPRAGHPDGRIRSETFHVADLMEWAAELMEAMERAQEAWVEFGEIDSAAWADRFLKAGTHCKFCPVAGYCPALAKKAEAEAHVWFKDETGNDRRNTPDRLMPEEVARILDHADMIGDWLNAVRAYAHNQAESGVVVPGYVLVNKQGREAWKPDVEDRVRAVADLAGLDTEQFQNAPKLKTPKQIRKALGSDYARYVDGLSATPSAGTSLVRADKTTRPQVAAGVNQHFDIID